MLSDKSPLFCIDVTVAHLHCRINAVHNYSDVVDEDHHVIYAQSLTPFVNHPIGMVKRSIFVQSQGMNNT